jgi:branched-chain amino acid transport system substrate-binding protein
MKKRHLLMGMVVLALALGLPGSALPQAKTDTIKIGAFLPMTGGVAAYGQGGWQGVQAARELKPTILGKKVELVLVDDKSDKIEAANAVTRLVEKEKVVAIIGSMISGNTMAGGPIAEKAGIPVISPTATNPLVTQGKKYIFRVCFIDPFQGEMAAKYAYETLKKRKAAMIIDKAQDYCVGLADFFEKSFTKLGGQIVAKTYCQTGDKDFTAQISAIKAKNPDVLYMPNYYTEVALSMKQAKDLGLNIPVLSGDGAQDKALIDIGKQYVEGLMFTGHFEKEAASTPLAKQFIPYYEKKYGKVGTFDVMGADAYFVLADAIERAKSTDGAKVRAALASTKNFKGISGLINIGEDGNAVKSLVIVQVRGGDFRYVATVDPPGAKPEPKKKAAPKKK